VRRVFRTKLLLPQVDDMLSRPRLLGFPRPRVLVVLAPAGAGKSVFLAQWAADQAASHVFYHLDEQDQQAAVFAAHVLTGFKSVWPDWQAPEEAWEEPGTLAVELVNEAAARPPVILVLDQLEAAFGQAWLADFLAVLLKYAPPSFTLALGSRTPLPVDLSAAGRAARLVTATDLAMTEAEAAAWLGDGGTSGIDGGWRVCHAAVGGYPLAMALWQQAGPAWRTVLGAQMLAGTPRHISSDATRALVEEWLAGRMTLEIFARQLSTGQPGTEQLWTELKAIRSALLLGDLEWAMSSLAQVWEKARGLGDRALLGAVALLRGEAHYCRGEYGQAWEWYRQAFEADPLLETTGTYSGPTILRDQGYLGEAEALARRCIAALQPRGDLQALAYAHAQCGAVLTDLGRYDEAEEHLLEAERCGITLSGEPFYGILARAYRALLATLRGNMALNRQLAEEAYALARNRSPWMEAICGYILAGALVRWREYESAQRLAAQSFSFVTRIASKWQLHQILILRASALWPQGKRDEAREAFDTGLGYAAREGYLQYLSSVRIDVMPLLLDSLVRGVEVPFCQEVLVRKGEHALQALLELAAQPDPASRRAAIYPLARIGGEHAHTAVRHLLYDTDEQVRDTAILALQSMGGSIPAPAAAFSEGAAAPPQEPPATCPASRLTVAMLGPMQVLVDGQPVQSWRTVKGRDMIAYLLLHGDRSVTRDQLVEALWPDSDAEGGQALLHTTLYYLRRALKPAGEGLITFAGGAYRLSRDSVEVDLDRFEQLAATGTEEAWRGAANLYRGDLLGGLDYVWCEGPRTRVRTLYMDTLRNLSDHLFKTGRPSEAAPWLQRVLQLDPLAESAHVGLMECYAATGNRNAALQQYRTLARLLDDELGLQPSRAAQDLYRRLLD